MPIETVSSWRDLDDAIGKPEWARHEGHARPTLVFRGLARGSYSNVTSLARLEGDYASLERHLLRNFRKYAHHAAPGPTMWDWLALGQHHGLPTRLLDWTFSQLVALHFATASWPEDDAVLWAVDVIAVHEELPDVLRQTLDREGSLLFTTELLARHAKGLAELDELGGDSPVVLFFEPPSLDERIVNQAAVLSTMTDPRCQLEDWLEGRPQAWRAWRIGPDLKGEIRARLDQAQITERLLLPGLDGIASWLRRYYSPRSVIDRAMGETMQEGTRRAQREGSMA